ILSKKFQVLLEDVPLDIRRVMRYQHDGTCWPVRSSDLSPLDFFLWRKLKNDVYRDEPPQRTDARKNNWVLYVNFIETLLKEYFKVLQNV
ncbi:hypothetical protein WH47_11061, partial [Habropoda laboriosa]